MAARRDIVTRADVRAIRRSLAKAAAEVDSSTGPPGHDTDRPMGGELQLQVSTDQVVPSPDTWQQRLMKYIPGEAIGVYVALDRAVQGAASQKAIWLGAVLACAVLFNIIYLRRVWHVQRRIHIIVSSAALVAYVYATGGVFDPLGWSNPVAQMVVLIATAAFLVFFEPPGPPSISEAGHESAIR